MGENDGPKVQKKLGMHPVFLLWVEGCVFTQKGVRVFDQLLLHRAHHGSFFIRRLP